MIWPFCMMNARVAMRSTPAFCSTSRTVTPSLLILAIVSNTSCASFGDRPSEASSISSSRGDAINPRATASICCSPPDSVPASCSRRSASRGKISNARSVFFFTSAWSLRLGQAPSRRLFATDRPGNTRRPSGTSTRPFATSDVVSSLVLTSAPS